jgi:hypothetical protein
LLAIGPPSPLLTIGDVVVEEKDDEDVEVVGDEEDAAEEEEEEADDDAPSMEWGDEGHVEEVEVDVCEDGLAAWMSRWREMGELAPTAPTGELAPTQLDAEDTEVDEDDADVTRLD